MPEQDIIEAIDFGYEAVQELITAQRELLAELGLSIVHAEKPATDPTLENFLRDRTTESIKIVLGKYEPSKPIRDAELDEIKAKAVAEIASLPETDPIQLAVASDSKAVSTLFKSITKKMMRQQVIETGRRVDGRTLDQVRPISCFVGVLPKRVHGTGLFNRGLTQVMSACTLGTPGDAQDLGDDLNPENTKRYIHHYNFPPYSVGETKPMRAPGRREIGHGALAERALIPVLPSKDEFPTSSESYPKSSLPTVRPRWVRSVVRHWH